MTIRDILTVDDNVCEIYVHIYAGGGYLHTVYTIGENLKPSKYWKFLEETQIGDVYKDGNARQVLIERNIQARNRKNPPANQIGCWGVLLNEIPKELLELEIEKMSPSWIGSNEERHRYWFYCAPLVAWGGIKGEDAVKEET